MASLYFAVVLGTQKPSGKKLLWIYISVFLIFFGINKQLDVQTLLILVATYLFYSQGWYEYRHVAPKLLFILVCGLAGWFAILILWKIRKIFPSSWRELTGLGVLFGFYVIRTGSITHVGKMYSIEKTFPHIHALEFIGLAIILYAVSRHLYLGRMNGKAGRRDLP